MCGVDPSTWLQECSLTGSWDQESQDSKPGTATCDVGILNGILTTRFNSHPIKKKKCLRKYCSATTNYINKKTVNNLNLKLYLELR